MNRRIGSGLGILESTTSFLRRLLLGPTHAPNPRSSASRRGGIGWGPGVVRYRTITAPDRNGRERTNIQRYTVAREVG